MTVRLERGATYLILAAFSLLAVYPIVSIVLLAFHRRNEPVTGFSIPSQPTLDNFGRAWTEGRFGDGLLTSAIVASTVVLASVVLSVLSGYALGTMRFPGATLIFYVLVSGLIIPYESLVIPLYHIFRAARLTDSYPALILPQIGVSVCLGTFWMRAFFRSAPRSVIEAARVDGAGHLRTLVGILVPQAVPAILTLAVLLFMYTWNDFLLALVMNPRGTLLTAPLALTFFAGSQRTTDQTVVAAAAVLVALPVVLAYAVLQRQFIRGFLSGAVKGE
ncbi:MAG TPA: carbohydrate ABC transporter permease [Candidatus Limnocylindrales bacterium]|nr:carbohydrate ABC transporter permease [Candidatus Limnocylindrales bacterium]